MKLSFATLAAVAAVALPPTVVAKECLDWPLDNVCGLVKNNAGQSLKVANGWGRSNKDSYDEFDGETTFKKVTVNPNQSSKDQGVKDADGVFVPKGCRFTYDQETLKAKSYDHEWSREGRDSGLWIKIQSIDIITVTRISCASSGPTQDAKCTNIGGKCQYTANACSAGYLTGYCPSSQANVKCCPSKPSGPVQDTQCKNWNGVCQNSSQGCSGGYRVGLCPSSGNSIKCCLSIKQDNACLDAGGLCQDINKKSCKKGYMTGKCPSSGNNIKCCPTTFINT
ncbi:uncharacterized protein EV422DRAFT_509242 [Fimicolochytrium jonesii]|uniref:uncharacterized protein n=1 Tax=Fimicolochytrium jonesii TaxID=1396493 RepID=UPI0022FDD998|nr:uncharacterized protein EV422DRAFT_509242 [Fimicolochytrium jonesii]KAI8817006.1 hypothetical protein EV422DRAFT_509242 [Fimicolochytrium jonesii]